MKVSISYSFFDSKRYEVQNIIPEDIQLSLYKFELFNEKKEQLLKKINTSKVNVEIVHLPIDCLRYETKDVFDMISLFNNEYGCTKFVIHPNKGIYDFVYKFASQNQFQNIMLCIENFPYKKRKVLRTPIEIIELCSDLLDG